MTYLDARNVLVGDSAWCYWSCFDALRFGEATVLCSPANAGMFEFFRDYLVGCERLRFTTEGLAVETREMHAGPWNREELYYFRRPLEPIVEPGPYMCFQPESAAHNKRKASLDPVECPARGYSVGVPGERILRGTLAFHGRSISEVARLIANSEGMIGIFSSMSLFASLLGKRVVVINYDGCSISESVATGFATERCRVVHSGEAPELLAAAREHFGEGWIR